MSTPTQPTEAHRKLAYEIIFASEDGSASPIEAALSLPNTAISREGA